MHMCVLYQRESYDGIVNQREPHKYVLNPYTGVINQIKQYDISQNHMNVCSIKGNHNIGVTI